MGSASLLASLTQQPPVSAATHCAIAPSAASTDIASHPTPLPLAALHSQGPGAMAQMPVGGWDKTGNAHPPDGIMHGRTVPTTGVLRSFADQLSRPPSNTALASPPPTDEVFGPPPQLPPLPPLPLSQYPPYVPSLPLSLSRQLPARQRTADPTIRHPTADLPLTASGALSQSHPDHPEPRRQSNHLKSPPQLAEYSYSAGPHTVAAPAPDAHAALACAADQAAAARTRFVSGVARGVGRREGQSTGRASSNPTLAPPCAPGISEAGPAPTSTPVYIESFHAAGVDFRQRVLGLAPELGPFEHPRVSQQPPADHHSASRQASFKPSSALGMQLYRAVASTRTSPAPFAYY